MSWAKYFKPPGENLFFKSSKTGDPRFGEISQISQQEKFNAGDFVIGGYPDDEGIHLNQGRRGAHLAPDAIRSRFYKTSKSEFHPDDLKIFDIGNLDTYVNIEDRHQRGAAAVAAVVSQGARWIGLGGGHDYGYADGAGFLKANKNAKQKPLIINFDAHLDVRPTDQGLTSGTPFYRLLTEEGLPEFDFYEIGIQRQCNSLTHIQWAKEHKAHILFYEDMMMKGECITSQIIDTLADVLTKRRPTYISVDIDSFSTAYAMGCSQAWPTGFTPMELFPVLNILFSRLDVQALGIYEVSPPLDQDERTVKLAAQIIHAFAGPLA